jgi:hypothetical protein
MNHAQIITAVAVNHKSLNFGPDAPKDYVSLASALMSHEPRERPTFDQALVSIKEMQAALMSQ